MSRILIPKESSSGETRVAATPETVKKFLEYGCNLAVEIGAGEKAGFLDGSYEQAGATLVPVKDTESWSNADVLLCVNTPISNDLSMLSKETLIMGLLEPYSNKSLLEDLQKLKLSALALELLPRISRAQSADVLSSQANIAGYKAVLLAASALDRYFPMLMTAAGTVQPAKIVVLGAGVAGLQAVATAKRLGGVVYVSDIRPAVKEQVESLGARFIDPPDFTENAIESGGYAKQVSEEFLLAQRNELKRQLSDADVAICTAQVPGKKAPKLIDEEMLDQMRSGSVVIDLAVNQGGNCYGTKQSETVVRKGVKLIGASDLARSVPNHASSLYSRNLLSLIGPFIKDGLISLNENDELIEGALISKDGVIKKESLLTSRGTI